MDNTLLIGSGITLLGILTLLAMLAQIGLPDQTGFIPPALSLPLSQGGIVGAIGMIVFGIVLISVGSAITSNELPANTTVEQQWLDLILSVLPEESIPSDLVVTASLSQAVFLTLFAVLVFAILFFKSIYIYGISEPNNGSMMILPKHYVGPMVMGQITVLGIVALAILLAAYTIDNTVFDTVAQVLS